MAKNVERILTKLQEVCDENMAECASDFAQHESWLLGTFKANALRQLTRRGEYKVELACPNSTKKQKTCAAPTEPAPAAAEEDAEPEQMQTDEPEAAAEEVRRSPRAAAARRLARPVLRS
jgi:hypothetical protein